MKIESTNLLTQMQGQVKVEKKEEGPKEQVQIGTSETKPDFMKKPQITAKGCAALGGATGVIVGGFAGGIAGTIDAGVGWAAQAIWGPTGGMAATIGVGVLHFLKGAAGKDGGLVTGLIGAGTGAASTYLGAQCGAAGLFYGGLATAVPSAIIAGAKLATIGGVAGGIAQAGGSMEEINEALKKETEKTE